MTVFTDAERQYLAGQPLGRLATLGSDGAPQVRPVGYRYNVDLYSIDIGGLNMAASRKYRNVQADLGQKVSELWMRPRQTLACPAERRER